MINFDTYIMPIQQRLDALEKRERYLVLAGAVFIIIISFYALIWEPIFTERDNQQQTYQDQSQLLAWMQQTNQQIKQLQSSGAQSTERFDNQSISSLIERSSLSMGIKPFIKKQTSDKNGVKLDLEQANFDRVILWLDDLQNKYGIQTSSIKFDRQDKPGTVNVRVTLERDSQ